ncbi:SDR family oxidoreductase [Phenylobacterium sp.]|uniref:SDR family NAD(P)-dependent oxidoreductase n=1 Tax=Phenylobacterium sp. TaxID=1871053 RepID=UPI002DEA3E19|nr:SDR family oxidoreductase [Phenylobacterium sp.]
MAGSVGRLAGKVAVVTGAGRGIGFAIASLLVREGAKVVVNDLGGGPGGGGRDEGVAMRAAEALRAEGGEVLAETSSIDGFEGAARLVEAAVSGFGRIDLVLNNAGIARPGGIAEMTQADLDVVLAVNLKGYAGMIHHAAPHFLRQKAGVVVNMASPSGFGHRGNTAYAAAKEAVVGLTRSAARDLGPFGVRCNALRPMAGGSQMSTPAMIESLATSARLGIPPLWNRWPSPDSPPPGPEQVAAVAVWLCTAGAAAANGREFYVAGQELGLMPEPELQRASFEPGGWTLDALDRPSVAAYLLGGVRNAFAGTQPASA